MIRGRRLVRAKELSLLTLLAESYSPAPAIRPVATRYHLTESRTKREQERCRRKTRISLESSTR